MFAETRGSCKEPRENGQDKEAAGRRDQGKRGGVIKQPSPAGLMGQRDQVES